MNLENIAIISDKHSNLFTKLGLSQFIFFDDLLTDSKISDWLQNNFEQYPKIDKIVIPVRLGTDDADYLGLRVGLHIRLSRTLKEKRLIPIVFISSETIEEIIGNQIQNDKLQSGILLFTKGTTLIDFFDFEEKLPLFNEYLNENELLRNVLPKLKIPNERMQGHQLANEWGAFRLAKFANIELKTIEQPDDLYFKYQFSLSNIDIDSKTKNKIGPNSYGCNALLIDDNASNGWEELIKHIIEIEINKPSSKFYSISTFEEANQYQVYEKHDIIFLDLRLKKEEDDSNIYTPAKDLSGLKLLTKIKAINKGIQVIIITASNKAWNMKLLLDEGADAYFIKESPEIITSDERSKENYDNFVSNIKYCFERRYLRSIYTNIKNINERLQMVRNGNPDFSFLEEIEKQLEIAFDMHYNAKSKEQFAYAYVTLYMTIELINKQYVKYVSQGKDDKFWYVGNEEEKLKDWNWNKIPYTHTGQDVIGNKPPEGQKIVGIWKQLWKQTNDSSISSINKLIQMRNHFIHNDTSLSVNIYNKKGFEDLFTLVNEILKTLIDNINKAG
jgi:CheY-like chemotaxis protein